MKNLLFLTWDSDQTNYLENLFFPILTGLQKKGYSCGVLQFSWAEKEETERLKELAAGKGISYTHHYIHRRPLAVIGTIRTLLKGSGFLKDYLLRHKVDILMARSTMPAVMVNWNYTFIRQRGIKIIFDADGMPVEERVDFSGLKEGSLQYGWLKKQETRLLLSSDKVLTRTQKAINIHVGTIGEEYRGKFYKVSNGRDPEQFLFDQDARDRIRKKLELTESDLLFVYSGTLGPQYGWEEMLEIFSAYRQLHRGAEWLVLTRSVDYLKRRIPEALQQSIHVLQVDFREIPEYLSAADVAFSLRIPAYSMKGVAPIKLGEYLLMGLPTIASTGIGDTGALVKDHPEIIQSYKHGKSKSLPKTLQWLTQTPHPNRDQIRKVALQHFTVQKSIDQYVKALG